MSDEAEKDRQLAQLRVVLRGLQKLGDESGERSGQTESAVFPPRAAPQIKRAKAISESERGELASYLQPNRRSEKARDAADELQVPLPPPVPPFKPTANGKSQFALTHVMLGASLFAGALGLSALGFIWLKGSKETRNEPPKAVVATNLAPPAVIEVARPPDRQDALSDIAVRVVETTKEPAQSKPTAVEMKPEGVPLNAPVEEPTRDFPASKQPLTEIAPAAHVEPSSAIPPVEKSPAVRSALTVVQPPVPVANDSIVGSQQAAVQPQVPEPMPRGPVTPDPTAHAAALPPADLKTTAFRSASLTCRDETIAVEPLEAGMMGLSVKSPCRAGQSVEIGYGSFSVKAGLDETGAIDMRLDLFQGVGKSASVTFADRTSRVVAVKSKDGNRITKVAVVWRAPVSLKLHVFESNAVFGGVGHIWAKAPSSYIAAVAKTAADGRGHGFISSAAKADDGAAHVEIYTFVRPGDQTPGEISMALDYETRGWKPAGETCGTGKYAALEYQFIVLGPEGNTNGGTGVLKPVDCGTELTPDQRYQRGGLPTLRYP